MYLNLYVNLREGDLCEVCRDGHPYQGRVVEYRGLEYAAQLPLFVFTCEGARVALLSEFDFRVLPYAESIRFLIDLAFDLHDEAWAKELFEMLLRRCQSN